MIRTQILLDRATYDALRRAAFAKGKGISAFVREVLSSVLGSPRKPGRKGRRYAWAFIGKSRDPDGARDVSARHDAHLGGRARW